MAIAIMSESTVVGVPRISIRISIRVSRWFRFSLSRPLLAAIVSIAIAVGTIATIVASIAISESMAISIMSQATVVAVPRIGVSVSRGISCGFGVCEDPGHKDSNKEQDLHIGCVWLSYDGGTPM